MYKTTDNTWHDLNEMGIKGTQKKPRRRDEWTEMHRNTRCDQRV